VTGLLLVPAPKSSAVEHELTQIRLNIRLTSNIAGCQTSIYRSPYLSSRAIKNLCSAHRTAI